MGERTIIIACLLILLQGCDRTDPAPTAVPAGTASLPLVPLTAMEPTVREQFAPRLEQMKARPNDPEAVGAVGMLLHAYDHQALAARYYAAAIELGAQDARWHQLLGMVDADRGDLDDAAASLSRVLEMDPNDLAAALRLAEVNRRRDRLEDALAGFNSVIASRTTPSGPIAGLEGDLARAYCGAGQTLLSLQRPSEAAQQLRRAVALVPSYGRAHYALGLALRELDQPEAATHELELAAEHRNREPPRTDPVAEAVDTLAVGAITALHSAIALLRDDPDPAELATAVGLLEEATRIDPALAEAHSQLGAALVLQGETDRAEQHIKTALSLRDDYADAEYHLGLIYYRRGDRKTADAHFAKVCAIQPDHFHARLGRGMMLAADGRRAEAIEQLRHAAALRPSDPRPHKHLGTQLAAEARYAEAVAALGQGMAAIPDDRSITQRLAWLLATCPDPKIRRPDEAVRLAREVCAVIDHPRALDTLAAAQAAAGSYQEAVTTAEQALQQATRRQQAELAGMIGARLELYRSDRPYVEPLQ